MSFLEKKYIINNYIHESSLHSSSSSFLHNFSERETEMEFCFELGMTSALRSSFLSDSSTFLLDDFLSLNPAAASSAAEVDFSSVDSFLDLSDDDKDKGAFLRQEEEEEISNSQEKSGNLDFTTAAAASIAAVDVEFPLPQQGEDFEDLEWLSRFVEHDEDNDSDSKLTFLNNVNHHHCRSQPSDTSPPPILLCFSSPIPSRSRSKRTRLAGKPWGSAAVTLSMSASSSSSSSSTISYGSSNPSITSTRPPKMKRSWLESEKQSRRCSHCHVEKTPQWRSGPLGAKTLCNACGVRYKSGRLFPEYRPACSPSFTGELHSNSHRKVLEMRRKKEIKLE